MKPILTRRERTPLRTPLLPRRERTRLGTPLLTLAALLTGAAFAAPPAPTKPAPTKYCVPAAFRDYEVGFGRAAFIRPIPGCNRPSLVRKVSDMSGAIYEPFVVTLPDPFPVRVWLFFSSLEYSLDGVVWLPLRLVP